MTKPLFTWDFFLGIFLGILVGILLLFFLYSKTVDGLNEGRERAREKEAVLNKALDYMGEIDMIKEWNEKAVIIEPEEEGK